MRCSPSRRFRDYGGSGLQALRLESHTEAKLLAAETRRRSDGPA
ncbi:MAG: hypothetical protein AB7O89_01390 [Parachlamydiales bacterium]